MMGRYTSGGIGRDVLAGAMAGGAAVWLISKMDWSLHHTGDAPDRSSDPSHAAAARAADAAGVTITDSQKTVAANTVHYGVGIGMGALYGLLRGMAPSVSTGRGSLFGVAAFILGDEIGVPAMGLSKGPLDYAARDHAKSALSHIVFGLFTDLGTRLLSPWKGEVVIMRGPTMQERVVEGRQALSDGRDYLGDQGQYLLDQGRSYAARGREMATDYAEQAREQLDELDLPSRAEQGRKRASRFASDLRSRLPEADDVSDAVETGRKRARAWWRSAADALPDRDDVNDALDAGRKRGRSYAKQARARMPDRDGVDEIVRDGRKRVERLAADASDSGSSLLDRASRWLFG